MDYRIQETINENYYSHENMCITVEKSSIEKNSAPFKQNFDEDTCDSCSRVLYARIELEHELESICDESETITNDSENSYEGSSSWICDKCGLSFTKLNDLNCHKERIHVNEVTENSKRKDSRVTCDECDQSFYNKSNLNRHKKNVHIHHHSKDKLEIKPVVKKEKTSHICHLCCQSFSKTCNLKRHNSRFHSEEGTGTNKKQMCDECGQSFSDRSNLMRHKTKIHAENKNIYQFECDICGGKFQWKKMWSEHMFTSHGIVVNKQTYVRELCETCGQSFHNKRNLLRHERSIHQTITFECSSCDKIFRRKDSLMTHELRVHCVNPEELKTYECFHCTKKFFAKHLAKRHIFNVHMNPKPKSSNVKCIECGSLFSSRTLCRAHYENVHEIKLEYEEIQFDSVEQFEWWKTDMQRTLVTQFSQQCTGKTSNGLFKRFVCHRSGVYKDLSKSLPRKRQLKNAGSKKIQGYCPAEIALKIQADKCVARFQSVHVGHTIASEEELRHIYLDRDVKKSIASRILDGVPKTELLQECRLSEKRNRSRELKPRDIWNISQNLRVSNGASIKYRKKATPVESACSDDDTLPVEAFVIRKDSILFNKNQGEEDSHFGLLKSNDFVMILMDQNQAECLQRYGSKLVAFDGSYGVNSSDFVLHTLLVLDVNYEILPVAFLLTNRNDRLVVDIFVRCIRDCVGIIKSETLMSDMQSVYLDSWTTFMEPPRYYLFCAWHVNRAWRQNLNKILDKRKRSQVGQTLRDLEQELDELLFEQKLNTFMSTPDNNLQNFLLYFRKNFYAATKQWAYCYRKYAGVAVSMRVEDFHDVLQQNLSPGDRMKTSFEGLKYLREFLIIKGEGGTIEKSGERLSKRQVTEKKHHLAAQCCEANMASVADIDDRTWQVVSFETVADNVTEIYTIRRLESKECSLYDDVLCQLCCDHCKICFHEYRCSCLESMTQLNMCQHVHVLGLYLRTHQLLELKETVLSDFSEKVDDAIEVETNNPAEPSCADGENFDYQDIEKFKSQILEEVQEALNFAKELPDLESIRTRFVQPMKLELMDKNFT